MLEATLRHRIAELEALWGSAPSQPAIGVRLSSRLTRSLGRADLQKGRISLARSLCENPALLDEVLCHEAAHVAAYRRVGRREPPHGPTWQRLVRTAGYEPTLRLTAPTPSAAGAHGRARKLYRHRCPVCQFTRLAARPVPNWRCRDCREAGLDGRLEIEAVQGPT